MEEGNTTPLLSRILLGFLFSWEKSIKGDPENLNSICFQEVNFRVGRRLTFLWISVLHYFDHVHVLRFEF